MSQMAGWDFDIFGVFVQPVMGDFVTQTGGWGGLSNPAGLPLSRRPWVPLEACLLLLIRPVTGGHVFLSLHFSYAQNYALCFNVLYFFHTTGYI